MLQSLLTLVAAGLTAAVAAPSAVLPSACYSPFHLDVYPLNDPSLFNYTTLSTGMHDDFALMQPLVHAVRTYYSSYYGVDVTPIAAAHNVSLYLGVYMTSEAWYSHQVEAAIVGAVNYPATVKAILVGNENVVPYGNYTTSYITSQMQYIKSEVARRSNGTVNVQVGTVQRVSEWLNADIRANMVALANASDVIGVNIYPFFSSGYDVNKPVAILDALWNEMLKVYPASKLRLTETGYATAGNNLTTVTPTVVPSLASAMGFYNGLVQWSPAAGGGEAFWFTFFDLRADDKTQLEPFETGSQKQPIFPSP
ncbi:hypothetical protein SPRG_17521 [Saprolegnia parasitica CBS 223.65]|uniref:glucan endo-1,3-beta-D-glucosidase n=1 Tax=Saprolegnia parasitica (strain CBS 223.65) TaxID=695850 RepID=A0A067BFR4_SAPPC|nr:hypothetical protein SPRG_17521 [Saprolegnia parasitica CBS 223.65]KDO16998.1 hypothetical protein SPRG_17521 [Saprolegnia parasitica CBS 223.65]|eukprot:XP_012212294.1 hypothetical protein SPRG_17521 [Saprolegnia parasitica CBS 223.65]